MFGIHGGHRILRERGVWLAGMMVLGVASNSVRADVLDEVLANSPIAGDATVSDGPDRPDRPDHAYGRKGSREWHLSLFGAAEIGITEFLGARVGVDWFVEDRFSLGLQLDLLHAWVGGGAQTASVGAAPILRWHFLQGERWTIYAEAGVGVVWNGAPIPDGGTRLDFTPQAALGWTLGVGDDTRLRVAVGWFHMSNARTSNSNPGLDALSLTAGLSWEF